MNSHEYHNNNNSWRRSQKTKQTCWEKHQKINRSISCNYERSRGFKKLSQFSCGHSPDKTASIVSESDEMISVKVCNGCFDSNKENFDKFHFEVVTQ